MEEAGCVVYADVIANIFSDTKCPRGQVGSGGCHGRDARLDFRGGDRVVF